MAGCRPLSEAEVAQVLGTFAGDFQGQRNQTLFLVGLKTGFRISELLSLTVADVERRGRITDDVTVAKRNRKLKTASHTVPLHHAAKQALAQWLACYKAHEGLDVLSGAWPLFPARQGGHQAITRVRAFQVLQAAYRAAGMHGRLATHTLRKTFAANVYERTGRNLFDTQQALGHKWITSTQAYLPVKNHDRITAAILG